MDDSSLQFYSFGDFCRLYPSSPGSMAGNDPNFEGLDVQPRQIATNWNVSLPNFSIGTHGIFEANCVFEDDRVLYADGSENQYSRDRDSLSLSPITKSDGHTLSVSKSSKRKHTAEEATPICPQSKRDGRGTHWSDKAQQGKAFPQPSIGNTQWAKTVYTRLYLCRFLPVCLQGFHRVDLHAIHP